MYLAFISYFAENNNTTISNNNNNNNSSLSEHESGNSNNNKDRDNGRDIDGKDRSSNRGDKERGEKNTANDHCNSKLSNHSASPKRPTSREIPPEREKNWNYPPGLDIMATGAFWQNYSGTYLFDSIMIAHATDTCHASPQ